MHEELEDVKDVMHKNIIKIRDRHGKLEMMEEQADRLEEQGRTFHRLSARYRLRMMLRERKMTIVLTVVIIIVLIIIVFLILYFLGVFKTEGD
ncbi:hypothetical protein FSP39_024316 [Pinctada imbricata]|uniref:V-SNARE coiled-coil homology domain-containing protein n=1 Tax=Pinctada imbricata TaxID=66713 RepID=A0AA89BY79_PINIB|nr:hypothetical protein FSP39_024316 [Pinctada imbricata]